LLWGNVALRRGGATHGPSPEGAAHLFSLNRLKRQTKSGICHQHCEAAAKGRLRRREENLRVKGGLRQEERTRETGEAVKPSLGRCLFGGKGKAVTKPKLRISQLATEGNKSKTRKGGVRTISIEKFVPGLQKGS